MGEIHIEKSDSCQWFRAPSSKRVGNCWHPVRTNFTTSHTVANRLASWINCSPPNAGFFVAHYPEIKNLVMSAGRLLSQFRIAAGMRPYVLRLRLRGTDFEFGSEPEQAVAYTKSIMEMRRILVEKRRIPTTAADRAILKSLEAAFDFQLASSRHRFLRTTEAQSHRTLDHLIPALRQLGDAIARLPPTSKGELNKRVIPIIGQAHFDSETFIEIVGTITASIPHIGPRRVADNILSLIHPEPSETGRPPLIDQWETMPAAIRVKVEAMLASRPARSLGSWLAHVADLLKEEQPARKRGAPRSISRIFVSRIATIWRTLGLNPGLAYDFFLCRGDTERGRHVESAFQRYCRVTLSAVRDSTEISARQVTNYKNRRLSSRT